VGPVHDAVLIDVRPDLVNAADDLVADDDHGPSPFRAGDQLTTTRRVEESVYTQAGSDREDLADDEAVHVGEAVVRAGVAVG
jgi:hypothetical protein